LNSLFKNKIQTLLLIITYQPQKQHNE